MTGDGNYARRRRRKRMIKFMQNISSGQPV
jgi:hypothetical protein